MGNEKVILKQIENNMLYIDKKLEKYKNIERAFKKEKNKEKYSLLTCLVKTI